MNDKSYSQELIDFKRKVLEFEKELEKVISLLNRDEVKKQK